MTDQPLLSPPDEMSEPVVPAPKRRLRDPVPWLYGLGFLILAAAILYVWQYPTTPSDTAAEASAIQTVEQRVGDMEGRLTRLEQRPPSDLGKITAQVDTLGARIADQTQLVSRVDTLSNRIEALSGRDQAAVDATRQQIDTTRQQIDAIKQQIDALTNRVAAAESQNASLSIAANRLNRIAKLQEATFALASGRPLGDLPNAPEALARYAHAAPPTEEQLRLRFQQDEHAALAAKQPDDSDEPLVGRVWEKARGLITIRRGDDVVVGNPSAAMLDRAQAALDKGDLAAAVNAVAALKGQPGQIMAAWLADAKALLSARSALADMADQA